MLAFKGRFCQPEENIRVAVAASQQRTEQRRTVSLNIPEFAGRGRVALAFQTVAQIQLLFCGESTLQSHGSILWLCATIWVRDARNYCSVFFPQNGLSPAAQSSCGWCHAGLPDCPPCGCALRPLSCHQAPPGQESKSQCSCPGKSVTPVSCNKPTKGTWVALTRKAKWKLSTDSSNPE